MKETLKHIEAFEYYYSLGEDRSLNKVAEHFLITQRAVEKWSSLFNWQERINERDKEIAIKLEEKTKDAVIETKEIYSKIAQAGIKKWYDKFQKGDIQINTVSDLEKLVKLELLLRGEPTGKTEVEHSGTISFEQKLREIIEG